MPLASSLKVKLGIVSSLPVAKSELLNSKMHGNIAYKIAVTEEL